MSRVFRCAVRCEWNTNSILCVDASRTDGRAAATLLACVASGSLSLQACSQGNRTPALFSTLLLALSSTLLLAVLTFKELMPSKYIAELQGGKVKGLHVSNVIEVETSISPADHYMVPRLAQSRITPCDMRSIRLPDVCARLDAKLEEEMEKLGDVASIDHADALLDQLCFQYVHDALKALDREGAEIPQAHHKCLMKWMRRQQKPEGSRIEPQDVLNAHPSLWPEIELATACGPYLADALSSKLRYQDLLFPEGSLDLLRPFYRERVLAEFYNKGIVAAVAAILSQAPHAVDWRVVEIGAGTGGTATDVLPVLCERCSIYLFTDVSEVFLIRARER